MFKAVRWRSEKNKIKAVFKLQFQATQVPQSRRNTLMISLVPEDVGKPTVRLGKAAVQDGTCSWENPVYETVKFIREPKTGKINEKIYYFVVSTGSSKSGFLGEVYIDFADFVEATMPLIVSLPLTTSNSSPVLHVTIQKMQGDVDQRDGDGPLMVKSQDRSLKTQMSNYDTDINSDHYSTENGNFGTTSQNAEQDGIIGSDTVFGQNNMIIHQDPTSFPLPFRQSSMPQKDTADAVATKNHLHRRSNTEWSNGSMADSTNSLEDNFTREGLQETSDCSIEKLRSEIVMLMRQAEVTELELESLRKQVVKESKKGQDLSRKIVGLKEERDALKTECEQLKSLKKCTDYKEVSKKLQYESEDSRVLLEEIREELNYEKDLNTNLRLKLQRTEDTNSELILAVRDLNKMLENKNSENSHLSSKIETSGNAELVREKVSKCKMDKDEDQQALEKQVMEHNDANEVDSLKQMISELYGEIEFYRKDREELVMQMEQLTLNHENLRKENHEFSKSEQNQPQALMKMQNEIESQVEILDTEIKKQAQELSESLNTIKELETEVRRLGKELEKQAEGFEDDMEIMTRAKIEQEQRAIRAEEALRKTRLNNANTAERLQEEFRRLSVEMASKFDENEKLATKALTEADELRLQNSSLEEMLQKANEELRLIKDQYEVKLQLLSNQMDLKAIQIEMMSSELSEKSKQLEYAKKLEEEKHESFSMEIQMLRTEMERLRREKNEISGKAEQKEKLRDEMEQMKISIDETDMLIQRWNKERDDLERKFASARKEAEKSQEELTNMKCFKDEKERMVGILSSEVEKLRAQYNELKHSLFEEELEKGNLRKQIIQLKGDLQKKEEAIIRKDKKLVENSERVTVSDVTKMTSRNKKSAPLPLDSKEVANLKEKVRLLEEQIKLKEAALENSTNSFLEKEKDLNSKIEDLKRSMEQLDHSRSFCKEQFQKEARCSGNVAANVSWPEEEQYIGNDLQHSNMSTKAGTSVQNGVDTEPVKSKVGTHSEKEWKISAFQVNECNLTELLTEVTSLKERNKSMEGELKEMQERYSEISLKFAEVEGERQKLVMTVRNLKNGKKN